MESERHEHKLVPMQVHKPMSLAVIIGNDNGCIELLECLLTDDWGNLQQHDILVLLRQLYCSVLGSAGITCKVVAQVSDTAGLKFVEQGEAQLRLFTASLPISRLEVSCLKSLGAGFPEKVLKFKMSRARRLSFCVCFYRGRSLRSMRWSWRSGWRKQSIF